MKNKPLDWKDFKWREITIWMEIELTKNDKVKRNEWFYRKEWNVVYECGPYKFLEWDIIKIINTQLVEQVWSKNRRNDVTFVIEREWKILNTDWKNNEYTFSWTLLIEHFFKEQMSNLAEVLVNAREKVKLEVKDISEWDKKK